MKYRVKQVGDRFYPEYRRNIFSSWQPFTDESRSLRQWCTKLEYAEMLIKEHIKQELLKQVKLVIKIHEYTGYNPDAPCAVTAALKQSECGTTCCTPDKE